MILLFSVTKISGLRPFFILIFSVTKISGLRPFFDFDIFCYEDARATPLFDVDIFCFEDAGATRFKFNSFSFTRLLDMDLSLQLCFQSPNNQLRYQGRQP